jgi:hypothetical protein
MNLKVIFFGLFLVFSFFAKSQSRDTISLSLSQVIDSVYGNLMTHIPSGFLLNRTLMDTSALAYNTNLLADSLTNADYFYGL